MRGHWSALTALATTNAAVTSEITITGVSSRQALDVEEVFQMATAGRIELKSLITKTYRYDEINEALRDLEHGKLRMGISLWN